jgi:signal recognition particle GTPase
MADRILGMGDVARKLKEPRSIMMKMKLENFRKDQAKINLVLMIFKAIAPDQEKWVL